MEVTMSKKKKAAPKAKTFTPLQIAALAAYAVENMYDYDTVGGMKSADIKNILDAGPKVSVKGFKLSQSDLATVRQSVEDACDDLSESARSTILAALGK
jgi:hypothetical protein